MGVKIGQSISHYKILRKLGHGGMGDVFLAENTRLGLKVALKFLATELSRDPAAIKRLEHEARAVAELSHPNISRINDIEEASGHRFLVLEYLEGETLSDRIQRGPLPIEETIHIGKALAEGLAHAHAHSVVHRDMKASNVMLTSDGGVKIMDFGLARMADVTRLTEPGTTLGTVTHMSPEQASGKEADERSDLWSLGVVLYQCLTGRLPFEGGSASVVLNQIGTASPPPPTSLRTGVPMDFDRLILRCLEKDPTLRFQHADDLLAELRRMDNTSPLSASDVSTALISSQSRDPLLPSRRWARPLIALAVVAVAVVSIWRPWNRHGPVDPSDNAETLTVQKQPNWILVAEFEGPRDDPDLAVAARELVIASLAQSNIVTPLSSSDLKRGLKHAMKPDTTHIGGEVARELAYRAAARTYVEGRIDRVMAGFSIVVHVKDAETGHLVHSISNTADNDAVLISALDRLGLDLRKKLGENEATVVATRSASESITPSYEAYRLYLQAARLHQDGNSSDALQFLHKALTIDPDFAAAMSMMMTVYTNIGLPDSSRMAFEEAIQRPHRLTESQYIRLEARRAGYEEGSPAALIRVYDRGIQQFPFNAAFYHNRGINLEALGKYEEALDSFVRGNEVMPFGASPLGVNNEYVALMNLGRFEEASLLLPSLGRYQPKAELHFATMAGLWTRAESLATLFTSDPLIDDWSRSWSAITLACLNARRGAARTAIAELVELASRVSPRGRYIVCMAWINLRIVTGPRLDPTLFPARGDSSAEGWIVQGLHAGVLGDTTRARKYLDASVAINPRPNTDRAHVEAWISANASRWDQVVQNLKAFGTSGLEPRFGRLPIRWLVADAYEHMGLLEKAAQSFELVLTPTRLSTRHGPNGHYALFTSFAHHRLVLLYSKLGQVEDARRHWEIFEKTFTNPDPELVPMVEEARQALAAAEVKL